MTKQITLTQEQARAMLGQDEVMDQLIRANFTEDELKPRFPKRWEDLGLISGCCVMANSNLQPITECSTGGANKNVFATEQQARSFGIIYPQITQLMKAYRGGWEPDWGLSRQPKFCIVMDEGRIRVVVYGKFVQPLSFQTQEIAQQFLDDHRDLITEFYKGM